MRILKTPTGFYCIKRVDGEDQYVSITEAEYLKLAEAQATKKTVARGVTTGLSITAGMAAGEALLRGAAIAGETAVVAAEGIALLPFIATGLLIAGTCAGGYAIYKAVKD